jgi:RAB protein geranylgeranyltransferase component A
MIVSMPDEAYEAIVRYREEFEKAKNRQLDVEADPTAFLDAADKLLTVLIESDIEDYSTQHDRPNGDE